jgi:ATP-binding cassette subfamily B protein
MSVALRSSVTVVGSLAMLFVTSPRLAGFTCSASRWRCCRSSVRASCNSRATARTASPMPTAGQRNAGRGAHGAGHARETSAAASQRHWAMPCRPRNAASARSPGHRQRHPAGVRRHRRVLWSGAHDVIDGRLSAGTLGQFVLYALIGGGSVAALAEVWNDLQRATGGMGRIGELLGEDADPVPTQPVACRNRCAADIQFDDVVFHYPRVRTAALDHFNLHVRPGETVALVGPSGAGKSTVLSMLLRFHDPLAGRICVDGIDVRQVDPAELRAQLALVPQQPTLFAASAPTTSATAACRPTTPSKRRVPPRPMASSARCRRATTASWASAVRACPAASSSAWRSPAPC